MKKIFYSFLILISIFSCTSLGLLPNAKISNLEIKRNLEKNVNTSFDLVFAKANVKVIDIYVKDYKLNTVINIEGSSIIGAIFDSKPLNSLITIRSDIKYENGKLYTKNVRVSDVKDINNEKIIRSITNLIIYPAFDNKLIYNFNEKGTVSPNLIKDVYIGKDNIEIDFK